MYFSYRVGNNQPRIVYRCISSTCGARQYTPGFCHLCGCALAVEEKKGNR